jgi:hypothetical protein
MAQSSTITTDRMLAASVNQFVDLDFAVEEVGEARDVGCEQDG